MKKKFVGCGGGRLRVRGGSVWGEYCVGEGKEEERGRGRLVGGCVVVLG
jgi:hypothetical protein